MSLIERLQPLLTEAHWDSELIGTSIRFPKAPELWTEYELSALYRANGLDAADSSSRIEKAQEYWDRMLSARNERIEHDVTFGSRAVRPECAFKVTGVLEKFIKGVYLPENPSSLPHYESLIELEPKASRLIEKSENSHGSVIYRVFYNDITSNKLVVETNDWLFALKVYLGHRDMNGNINLG